MTTDNRTSEPTEAQVEAAAKIIRRASLETTADPGDFWSDCYEGEREAWRNAARAALVAAAKAAPQAESSQARDLLALAKHLHRKYGRNQPTEWNKLSGDLQMGWLVEAENTPMAAPVQPSSTVDEGKIAKVIAEASMDYNLSDRSGESYACGAPDYRSVYIARAVVEAIGGEGRG